MVWIEQVKQRFRFPRRAAFLALGLLATASALGETPPNARELLARVRANERAQEQQFTGRLRTSTPEGRVVIPFALRMDRGTFTYQFANPPETLVLRLGEKGSRLEKAGGPVKLAAPVRGTDVSYEDLSLKFLYWNNARVIGEDNLMTRHCWVVESTPGGADSQYDRVRLWIEKTGALMKAECFSGGRPVRRFEVRNVQRASGGGYILKTLRILKLEGGKDRSPTYLELNPE